MKLLVDTSVWVEFLRSRHPWGALPVRLQLLLTEDRVMCHPAVIGELACGNLHKRAEVLGLLRRLPSARESSGPEALELIERESLHGLGLGWTDVQLLAAARLSESGLWTLDRRLARAAGKLGVTAA